MNFVLPNAPRPTADIPHYSPLGNECALFETAWVRQLPLLLKGPTGCGKTRFVSHMAARLGLPLSTVSCHDDLAAADLTGRYLLKGGDTVWAKLSETSCFPECGVCYLDEIVEARKDVAVVLHPLTDDRRMLPLERTGEMLEAPSGFMLVVSYNPGYQNLLKSLKPSTRQRFVAIEFDFLPKTQEIAVVSAESGLAEAQVARLVNLAARLRALKGHDLEEGVSTRLLVYCASLIDAGMPAKEAVRAAMIEPLTDEPDVRAALLEVADSLIA
ncbi:CbbQ/NirQ/NorQ/GpvN family protein [Sinorhizobium sp. 7-81]|uniref:CbbQ/NirQ/NorQ/GpvN family protein n=1 Tax=Sinorhizobium sp. 8-89 TaxID=3049089 RepID=UPI0024C28AA3|nr:CbbQ/NirQ/NorQ/GpvN family protein [Sinorhizobium sp. 8-89]MDK1493630.1 CbbQ/NirQ/NorQ/GpvN family protein [Sinorhizobium sp. 8-89]